MKDPKTKVKIIGEDGNALAIIGRCLDAARDACWSTEEISLFFQEATSGDYDHLLVTVMKYFDVT